MNKKIFLLLISLLVVIMAVGSASAADTNDSHVLNDTTYDNYFDDQGYFLESVSDNTTFVVGNLTNKEFHTNGNNISLIGDDLSIQRDVTIRLGDDGEDYTGFIIKNLKIENKEKIVGIIVQEGVSNALIADNYIHLNSTTDYGSVMATVAYGNCRDLTIENNTIVIDSNGGYVYGIDSSVFKEGWATARDNGYNYIIKDNTVTINGKNSMGSGIYLDGLINCIVDNNRIFVNSTGGDNYGVSISYSGVNNNPINITISKNLISLSGINMVYGIENYGVNNITLEKNWVEINSTGGCFAIASNGENTLINDNYLETEFGSLKGISSYDYFGVGNQSVYIMSSKNVNVTNNFLKIENEDWLKNKSSTKLAIENNYFVAILNDETYNNYFDENGYLKESVFENTIFMTGNLTNKDLIIDLNNISLVGIENTTQSELTISIGDGVDSYSNIILTGLNILNVNKITAISINDNVSDVLIDNNDISINASTSWGSVMAIVSYGGAKNVNISYNDIFVLSNCGGYVYGIDSSVYKPDYSPYSQSPTNHNIISNNVTISGNISMAEGIYYDELVNGVISNNLVTINGVGGDIYGIALSYSYANTHPENVTIDNNTLNIFGTNMVYGIELSDVKSINITNNDINTNSTGGTFSIAVNGANLLIDSNSILTYSKSTKGISSYDGFGVGNQSVYVKNSNNVNVTNNIIYSNNINWLNTTSVTDLTVKNNTMNINLIVENQTIYYRNGSAFEVSLFSGSIPLANQEVTISVNGENYTSVTNNLGTASFLVGLSANNYTVTVSFKDIVKNATLTVLPTIKGKDLTLLYRNGSTYTVKVVNGQGNVVANQRVGLNVNGILYDVVTDYNGIASLPIGLSAGNYIITAYNYANGEMTSNNITVLSRLSGNDLELYYRNGSAYTVKVVDGQGNPSMNHKVTTNVNGVFYNLITDSNGVTSLPIGLNAGKYVITVQDLETGEMTSNNITVKSILTENQNLELYYRNGSAYAVKALDGQGNPAKNVTVTFNVNGVFYYTVTDSNGVASLPIGLNAGSYIITADYIGFKVSNTITVKPILIGQDITLKYRDGTNYTVQALDNQGKPAVNVTVNLNVNGVIYNVLTDSKGIASLPIGLNVGNYIITAEYKGFMTSNTITILKT